MEDTSTLTVWVAIIAMTQLVIVVMLAGAAVVAWRAWRKATYALRMLEREYLEPTMLDVRHAAADVQDTLARFRAADDDLRQALSFARQSARQVFRQVRWPAIGVARGLQAALAAIMRPSRASGQGLQKPGHQPLVSQRGETHARS